MFQTFLNALIGLARDGDNPAEFREKIRFLGGPDPFAYNVGMASLGRLAALGLLASATGCGLLLDTGSGDDPSGRRDAGTARTDADRADGEAADAALPPPECDEASDCGEIHGAAPCSGDWVCTPDGYCGVACPDCTDGDHDGYGSGAGCLGGDCDDADFFARDVAFEACTYGGPAGTVDVGACRAATRECIGGTWTDCTGEIVPAGETCNSIDDDCNGTVDDAPPVSCGVLGGTCETTVAACSSAMDVAVCPALPPAGDATCDGVDDDCDGLLDEDCTSCVYVSLTGSDLSMNPTTHLRSSTTGPLRSIQRAIDQAARADTPDRVCVLADALCGNARYDEQVVMRPGVSVHGSYDPGTGRPCSGGGIYTEIESRATSVSVDFSSLPGAAITELANMRVYYGQSGTNVAAIRVNDARGVRLSNVQVIAGGATPDQAVAIDVAAGSEAFVTATRIDVAAATTTAIGVRAVGSRVMLRGNCDVVTGGRCDAPCTYGTPGIHTLETRGATTATGTTAGVWLEDAAGSIVDTTRICGTASAGTGAGVWVTGDASGVVVSHNLVRAYEAEAAGYGVHLEACRGGAPRVVDNDVGAGAPATAPAEGIYAGSGCHAVIAHNTVAGALGGRGLGTGVRCAAGSQCVVVSNDIAGTLDVSGTPTRTIGLHCDGPSCARVEENVIHGGSATASTGMRLEGSRAVIDDNVVTGGCGSLRSVGIDIANSPVRITNSVVRADACADTALFVSSPEFVAMNVEVSRPGAEPDVSSNLLDGAGRARSCASVALRLEGGGGGPLPSGIFRNNVLVEGLCDAAYHVFEAHPDADPRALEHNAFDDSRMAFSYVDEATMPPLSTITAVESLPDTYASGTLDRGCGYTFPTVFEPRLDETSPCVDSGKVHGAPEQDMYEDTRDAIPDIGPDEHVP